MEGLRFPQALGVPWELSRTPDYGPPVPESTVHHMRGRRTYREGQSRAPAGGGLGGAHSAKLEKRTSWRPLMGFSSTQWQWRSWSVLRSALLHMEFVTRLPVANPRNFRRGVTVGQSRFPGVAPSPGFLPRRRRWFFVGLFPNFTGSREMRYSLERAFLSFHARRVPRNVDGKLLGNG